MLSRKPILRNEDLLQSQFCRILSYINLPYFSIPNGAYKSKTARYIFSATGLKEGVPDLCIPRAYHLGQTLFYGHYIETKNGLKGRISDAQSNWHRVLLSEGYGVTVAHSLVDLYKIIYYCYPEAAARIRGIENLI